MLLDTKVTTERHSLMAAAGFVHVTGLTEIPFIASDGPSVIGRDILARELGRSGGNNSTCAIYTVDGQVWLATYSNDRTICHKQDELMTKFGPNGRGGVWVPCSNGGKIPFCELMARMSDPNWNRHHESESSLDSAFHDV